jgi:hypothetical protein
MTSPSNQYPFRTITKNRNHPIACPKGWICSGSLFQNDIWYYIPSLRKEAKWVSDIHCLNETNSYSEPEGLATATATLTHHPHKPSETNSKYLRIFEINGHPQFKYVGAELKDWLNAIGKIMSQYHSGKQLHNIDVTPETGRPIKQKELPEQHDNKQSTTLSTFL